MRKNLYPIFLIILSLVLAHPVSALTVSPAKIEITADPGGVAQGEIEIFNEQSEAKTFYTSYENFESRGDSGAPYFIGANGGLATWISTAPSVTIAPGQRVKVPYTVSVPNSAKPGGYFAAIFFGSQPPAGSSGEVSIGGKIGVLLLLRVAGDVEESAGLVNFNTKDEGRLYSSLPITFEYALNNTGGDRAVPTGEIKIKNTIRLTSAKLLANDREGSVLPNSTRRFEVVWGDKGKTNEEKKLGFFAMAKSQLKDFHLGWYTAKLDIGWGATGQTAFASYNFFVFPWQLLSIVLFIALVIWFIFRSGLSRYKRKIIEEIRKQK